MATRKPRGPEPLVLHIGGEEFALTAPREIEIDGEKLTVPGPVYGWVDQLDFGEQIEVRRIARELSGDREAELTDFNMLDLTPALITVLNKRTNDKFELADALKLKWDEAAARPPKQAAKPAA
jgi:hypothetical protein